MNNKGLNVIDDVLDYLDKNNLYPDQKIIESSPEPIVKIEGRDILMFSSNNYLGLGTHPKVINAAIEATKKYGVGADGSRLLSGNLKIHRDFELAIAKFKGGEDAIVWPTGYSANLGAITAIMDPPKIKPGQLFSRKGIILSDELNHASIVDGCRMSRQIIVVYKHCDMRDLEKKLRRYRRRRKLVVTDGVFSMDGDVAPLNKISNLCKKYGSMLMIDEAHSTGIQGKYGHGTIERFGLSVSRDVDIVLGTCSKALAATGGFVVGSKNLIRYLRIASRSYIFSTAMTPGASAALIAALEVIEDEPTIREQLISNSDYLRSGLKKLGFDTLNSETQIVPLLIGEDDIAIKFSRLLFDNGIYGPCVRWPAVEKGKARIRFSVMSVHKMEHIEKLLYVCGEIGRKLNLI